MHGLTRLINFGPTLSTKNTKRKITLVFTTLTISRKQSIHHDHHAANAWGIRWRWCLPKVDVIGGHPQYVARKFASEIMVVGDNRVF